MKDYLLQIKIKNGPMMSIMRANNIETAAELSRLTGITQGTIGKYLNLQSIPFSTTGGWKDTVVIISECLKVPPEMLFPEQHLTKALKRNTIEGEVTLEEMGQLVSSAGINHINEMIEKDTQDELHDRLERGLKTLASRERKVLEQRFGINQKPEEALSNDFKEIDLLQFPYKIEEKTVKKKNNTIKTYKEVGDDFSVTPERIRQIEAKALRKLRHPRHNKNSKCWGEEQ